MAATFFLLTFVVTWTAWIAPAMWAPDGNRAVFGPGGAIFVLGVFAPGLVALGLTARAEGRAGVARLLAGIGRCAAAAAHARGANQLICGDTDGEDEECARRGGGRPA